MVEISGFTLAPSCFVDYKTSNQNKNLLELTDEEILENSVDAPEIFEVIVSRYEGAFLRKARSIVWNVRGAVEATDMVQDTFVKIYLNAHRFERQPGASFRSWAYKILVNTCLSHLKKAGRENLKIANMEPEVYEALPDTSDLREKKILVDEALCVMSKMPVALREVLEPILINGLTQQDLSRQLKVSAGALRTRIHRAKKLFRQMAFVTKEK